VTKFISKLISLSKVKKYLKKEKNKKTVNKIIEKYRINFLFINSKEFNLIC